MQTVFIGIAEIFGMILIGYASCKTKLISLNAIQYLIKIILVICIPCMLLSIVTQNELDSRLKVATLIMLGCGALYFVFAEIFTRILIKVFRITDIRKKNAYLVIGTALNTGFIGFPLAQRLFGNEGFYFMVLFNIVMNIYLYGLCPSEMKVDKDGKRTSIIDIIGQMINPCIVAALIGIAMLFCGIHFPAYIINVIDPIGDSTIPMAMILVGMQLANGSIIDCIRDAKLLSFSIVAQFLRPWIVMGIVIFLPLPKLIIEVLILGAALPPATTISAIAEQGGSDGDLAARGIIVTTLLSILSLPMAAWMISTFVV